MGEGQCQARPTASHGMEEACLDSRRTKALEVALKVEDRHRYLLSMTVHHARIFVEMEEALVVQHNRYVHDRVADRVEGCSCRPVLVHGMERLL